MSQPEEEQRDHEEEVRDETWADRKFPGRGETPSNVVVVDPDVEPSPNIAHPK